MSTVCNPIQKRHRLRKLRGETAYVDATAARLHIAALMGASWSLRAISGASGVPTTTLSRFHRGQQVNARPETITAVLGVRPDSLPSQPSHATAEPFVPRIGTTRRIQALLRIGWTHAHLSEHSGLRTAVLVNQQGRWVTRSTHDRIAALYRDLSMKPGPSERTRARAERRGYPSPADWDNIDMDAEPDTREAEVEAVDEVAVLRFFDGDRSIRLNHAERCELVRRWVAAGRPLAALERAGWAPRRYLEDGAA